MITALLFIVILAFLVFVHELGHFIVARMAGMRVDEFGIGFPPRLYSWKKGETVYSLNALPLGGFVKIHGEDQSTPMADDTSRSFGARPRYWQALVLVAGVSFNIICAWLVTSAGLMYGLPVSADSLPGTRLHDPRIIITKVLDDSPAFRGGLVPGDQIISLSRSGTPIIPQNTEEVRNFIAQGTTPVDMYYVRRGATSTATLTPAVGITSADPAIGIGLDSIGIARLPIHLALWHGIGFTWSMLMQTLEGLGQFLSQVFVQGKGLSQVSGPVGIAHLVGDARRMGVPYIISFVSFISINLAVINLIPFPALDGGRLLFVAIEAIIRRPLPAKISRFANTVGFLALLTLMVVVTYHDIIKLIAR